MKFQLDFLEHNSHWLKQNPLGDPEHRTVTIITPSDRSRQEAMPAIWMLSGYGGTGTSFLSFVPWQETLLERVNRLWSQDSLPAVRFILPDVFTSLGGSQYLDSSAIGPYESYLWSELLPFVEEIYPVTKRGLAGKSSGGYGALIHGMRHPEIFSAVAAHSADMLFEWAYLPDFPKLFSVIRQAGGEKEFWQAFRISASRPADWFTAMSLLAMAAAYSPNPDNGGIGVDLPLDPETLERRDEVWARWVQWDPLSMVLESHYQAALKSLALLYFDVGQEDEYNLQYGARRFQQILRRLSIPHVYEEFGGGHRHTTHRYDKSLPLLARTLGVF